MCVLCHNVLLEKYRHPEGLLQSKGALPLEPRGISLSFPKGQRKRATSQDAAPSQIPPAAQVAPQRCPILHTGKVTIFYSMNKHQSTIEDKVCMTKLRLLVCMTNFCSWLTGAGS